MIYSDYDRTIDLLTGQRRKSYKELVGEASKNIAGVALAQPGQTAQRLARAVEGERTHRVRFDYVNKGLFNAVQSAIKLGGEDVTTAESALVALHDYIRDADNTELHRLVGHKGIAVTLGYVEQNGHWGAARQLDRSFRSFPHSTVLADSGFKFADTYGSKEGAHLSYDVKLDVSSNGTSLLATRKRAAADVIAEGTDYDVIKRSSFLIDATKLDTTQLGLVAAMLNARYGDAMGPTDDEEQAFGAEVVEPAVAGNEDLKSTGLILPVASSYVALHRFE